MKWTEHLSNEVYNRLANCRTLKSDLPALINAKWLSMKEAGKDKQGFTKEDAVVSILELLDCNGCDFEITMDDYNELIK